MDKETLLKSLNDHNVEYVVIGATAFPIHGWARSTLDIDIFIRDTEENAKRTYQALRDFGYDVTEISPGDLLEKKVLIRQYIVALDVHPFVDGVEFEDVWEKKVSGAFEDVTVFYASLEDLITMKEAAGRPKDLEDLKYLRKLRE